MLEVVDVDVLVGERGIGRDPIGELDHLHVEALLLGFLRSLMNGIGREAGIDADSQRACRLHRTGG